MPHDTTPMRTSLRVQTETQDGFACGDRIMYEQRGRWRAHVASKLATLDVPGLEELLSKDIDGEGPRVADYAHTHTKPGTQEASAPLRASSVTEERSKTNGRRTYVNPACSNVDEMILWHHERENGAQLPSMIGFNEEGSEETRAGPSALKRAHFRMVMCMFGAVEAMSVKIKRRIYDTIRNRAAVNRDCLFPEVGLTGTQLAIMHSIKRTTRFNCTTAEASALAQGISRDIPRRSIHELRGMCREMCHSSVGTSKSGAGKKVATS